MKKTVKKTNKVVKPEFIMNCVNNVTPGSLYVELIEAKVRAGKPISKEELDYIKGYVINVAIDEIVTVCSEIPYKEYVVEDGAKLVFDEKGNAKVVKPNIFRRFWNWITRKNK